MALILFVFPSQETTAGVGRECSWYTSAANILKIINHFSTLCVEDSFNLYGSLDAFRVVKFRET